MTKFSLSSSQESLITYRDLYVPEIDGNPDLLSTHLEILDGIGVLTAQRLRATGITDWYDLAESAETLTRRRRAQVLDDLSVVHNALTAQDVSFFAGRLQRREYWRIAAAFPSKTAFFDIETTGLSHHYHQVTVIGWILAGRYTAVIGDPTETASRLAQDLHDDTVIVTYNGAHFDLPFLARHVPDFHPPAVHVDLRHLAERVGLTGGQKKIEREIGVTRAGSVKSVRGEAAPGLWFKYTRGDVEALRDLIEYNHADVDGLRQVLQHIVAELGGEVARPWEPSDFATWLASDSSAGAASLIRPYLGYSGPRVTAQDLRFDPTLRVVGIDLTGSAKRATGWAALEGLQATTMRVNEDADIVDMTLAFEPDLVSIDAPLSLPRGRIHVEDSDPGRQEFGIAREAERILWRRGVKTYPALIQSMQQLTARGIRLATTLRQSGVPVIESFPGAMQDILGMPRKGLSITELKHSLVQYGLTGPFTEADISHDELDALSSAIVAHFFLDGRYEALGDEHEEPMIVPALDASLDGRPVVVAIAGPVAAGKSTLASALEKQGFTRTRFSEVLLRHYPNPGTVDDREHLRLVGQQVNQDGRQRWLARTVLASVAHNPTVVIDGVRYPDDYAVLYEENPSRMRMIYLTISDDVRRDRYTVDSRRRLPMSEIDQDHGEQHQQFLRTRADHVFDNSGPIEDLHQFATNLRKEVTQWLSQSS